MKKLLVLLLALTMVIGLGTTALAEPIEYDDDSTVTISKTIDGEGYPTQTFTFTIGTGTGLRDGVGIDSSLVPQFTGDDKTFTIQVEAGATDSKGSADIDLRSLDFKQVGEYTYSITESDPQVAGFSKDSATRYLKITVINNPDYDPEDTSAGAEPEFLRIVTLNFNEEDTDSSVKTEDFVNLFSSGSLEVNKVVTGNYADPNDTFPVTVTLTAPEGMTLNAGAITAVNAESGTTDGVVQVTGNNVATLTYNIRPDNPITINNIPTGVRYTVEETDIGEYDSVTYSGDGANETDTDTGTVSRVGIIDGNKEVTITNTRNIDVAVGVVLDNLPYILVIGLAVLGLAIFMVSRRRRYN